MALKRLGVRPPPSVEPLRAMTEDERHATRAASMLSPESYEQLRARCQAG